MSSRSRGAAALLAAGCAALALVACGKKGDPLPPLLPIPAAAEDLTVQQRGSELILRFGYPRTTAAGQPLGALERIEVYELVRPALERRAEEPETPEEEAQPEDVAPEAATAPAEPDAGEPFREEAPAEVTAGEETPAEEVPAEEVLAGEVPASQVAGQAHAEISETALPGPTEPPTGATSPGAPRWLAPPIDARELAAAAKVVVTLREGELADAVRGDRLVFSLPLELSPAPADETVPPNARYYAIRTVGEGGFESALSNRAGIVPEIPPPPPTGLTADPRADGIEIGWRWDDGVEIAAFAVYRRLATERDFGEPLRLVGPAQSSFTDSGARYGQRYLYAVTAVARRAPLIESAIAAAREVDYRDVFAPPVPASVVALADAGAVRVVWDESRAPDLTGYHVYRRRGDGDWRRLTEEPSAEVEYLDRDVAPGETFAYRVTALDELGNESEPSPAAETLVR